MIIISLDIETPSKAATCQLHRSIPLLDVLEKYHARATLFLSIFEQRHYPIEFNAIVEKIHEFSLRNELDVQLHVHPERFTGKSKKMSDSPLEQQVYIISEAKRLFVEYFPAPCAIRAGGYHANRDTLEAAVRNGIHIDSSYWVGLQYPALWEIPIETYYRKRFGFRLQRKADIDWSTTAELLDLYAKHNYLHVMGHSYSDPEKLEKFIREIDVSDLTTFGDIEAWRCDMPEANVSLQSYVHLLHGEANYRLAPGRA